MMDTALLEALCPHLADGRAAVGVLRRHDEYIDCEALVAPARLGFDTRNTTRDARCDRARVVRL
jgi:hypothetical protein